MTQNEKELLLKDTCARIPYGVKAYVNNYWCEKYEVKTVTGVDLDESDFLIASIPGGRNSFSDMKTYLFPLSSMTEEQYEEFIIVSGWDGDIEDIRRGKFLCLGTIGIDYIYDTIDWLNKNHFDYRGLIEMELALDATGLNIY